MILSEYQKKAYRAIPDHRDHADEISHWSIGLAEEAGEVLNVIKHHLYGGEELNKEELIKEAGDVMWYLSALCTTCGIDLGSAAQLNLEKLLYRFPDEFDNERSKERHELEKKFSETDKYREIMRKAVSYDSSVNRM